MRRTIPVTLALLLVACVAASVELEWGAELRLTGGDYGQGATSSSAQLGLVAGWPVAGGRAELRLGAGVTDAAPDLSATFAWWPR